MVLQLHVDKASVNCHKVVAALDYMEVQYQLNHVDFLTAQHKTDDYLKINPNGTIPSASDDGLVITQSNAIMQYAADIGGEKGAAAYPREAKQRATVNAWLFWESSGWFQSNYVYLAENLLKLLYGKQPDPETISAEETKWLSMAIVLDSQLGKTKYITGDVLTIADFAIMAPMHLHDAQKLPLDKTKNLQRWVDEMESIPAWKSSQDYVNKAFGFGNNKVHATLNYTRYMDGSPAEVYFYEDSGSADVHEPGNDAQQVMVEDGWARRDEFSEDKNGFAVRDFQSAFPKDKWGDYDQIRSDFYPEVVDFVKVTTGARRVLVFDHTIRSKLHENKKLTNEEQTSQRAPVRLVHCDYTKESGPLRVRQLLGDEAEMLFSKRVAFFNIWKPLAKVEEMPLAMCDVSSSSDGDLFKLLLHYRDRMGENYVMRYSPQHKWVYFPYMEPDQCIVLKTYDSDESVAQFVGHSAFEDPTSRPDAPYRESVEIRTMAFF